MSGMIRRLRWKIVGISMLFVTLVLAAVFTGVMLTARSSLEQSSTRQLEKALRGEGYDGQNGQPCFVTEVYSSGTVRVMGSSYYQISEEDLLALVQECLSQQEESGLLTDYHLRYLRYDGSLSIRIAFTDSTLEQSALRAMAGNLLLIALAALVAVPIYFLTRRSLGTDIALMLLIVTALPFFFLALYEKNGQPPEKLLRNYLRVRVFTRRERPYQTQNRFAALERQTYLQEVTQLASNSHAAKGGKEKGRGLEQRFGDPARHTADRCTEKATGKSR